MTDTKQARTPVASTESREAIVAELIALGWQPGDLTAERIASIGKAFRRQAMRYQQKSQSVKAARCIARAVRIEESI